MLKAQIHAGGRGKGGGVKLVKSNADLIQEAKKMFGMKLITHQTGPEGREVKIVYICSIGLIELKSLVVSLSNKSKASAPLIVIKDKLEG